MRKKRRTESTPGRKPKEPNQRATKHIGAGVSLDEWPQVERFTADNGGNRSAIIRGAFGLPPAVL